jgi:hypothetical protein
MFCLSREKDSPAAGWHASIMISVLILQDLKMSL